MPSGSARALAFPGDEPGSLGKFVYDIHHGNLEGVSSPSAAPLQLLHVAAHLDAIERLIRPAIDSGTTVLLDRYWWSTWAYGMDEGIDRRLLAKIIDVEKVYWGDLTPDMVFLLVPPRPYSDEISIAKYNRLSRLYRTIVQETRLPVNVMDQSMTREESAEHVAAQLAALARTERS